MKQRLLVAAIGVPLLIVVLVILPPVAAWILTAAIAAAAAWELLHTAGKHDAARLWADDAHGGFDRGIHLHGRLVDGGR